MWASKDKYFEIIRPPRQKAGEEVAALLKKFEPKEQERVRNFHRSLPGFAPTPLLSLPGLARQLGVGALYLKDESRRLGLNAFKALGASYAVAAYLAKEAQAEEVSFAALQKALEKRPELRRLSLFSATDGNHGRGLSWFASLLGLPCRIYMPQGTVPERLEKIKALGARAEIFPGNYDECVAEAAKAAAEAGGLLVQDTAWPGYVEIPLAIMEGYGTMAAEIAEELQGQWPTHVFLQAGVGSMAAAVTACLVNKARREALPLPKIIIVEPTDAACLFATAAAGDGRLHQVTGKLESMMAGLCCGLPCSLAWQLLAPHADAYCAMGDFFAAEAMCRLARPAAGDAAAEGGESGAAGLGCLIALAEEKSLEGEKKSLGLDRKSVVLCLLTEGATDRANYEKIVCGR